MMPVLLLAVFVQVIVYSQGLECGVGRTNSEELKQTLNICVRNNETLQKIWDMTASSASSESNSDSSEEPIKIGVATKLNRRIRIKRSSRYRDGPNKHEMNKSQNGSENTDETTTESDTSENCMVHCVFNHMGMTDSDGFPEHGRFVDELLKTASNRELRDFLQDTADECFQQISQENDKDPCSYSSKLVTCLADKGKSNCADWPAANLPF